MPCNTLPITGIEPETPYSEVAFQPLNQQDRTRNLPYSNLRTKTKRKHLTVFLYFP